MIARVYILGLMVAPIPVYRFDEHNAAFYYWHKARFDGYLDRPLDIYHVDAHSDMAEVSKLEQSLYRPDDSDEAYLDYYQRLAHQLSIANFIIPAVLNQLIRNIYFIYPHWRGYKRQRSIENVSTGFGEGKIFKHGLTMTDAEQDQMAIAYPDLTRYSYIRTEIDRVPMHRKVILDIDLDYFACTDSITNAMRYRLSITKEQYRNQAAFREENQSLPYSGLEIEFVEVGGEYFAELGFEAEQDESYLPTEADLMQEIDRLVEVLAARRVRPAIVTLCRSCVSGYCPPGYFEMIETALIDRLQDAYPSISMVDA